MLSNKLLVDAIKSGATNEEIYELVRSIYGEAMKQTYYSLLKRDKYYQSLLTKTDEAEKKTEPARDVYGNQKCCRPFY